jgi:hypothetical protein
MSLLPQVELAKNLEATRFRIDDVVFYDFNLFLRPLDVAFPRLAVWSARHLKALRRSPLRRLATAYLMKAIKLESKPS